MRNKLKFITFGALRKMAIILIACGCSVSLFAQGKVTGKVSNEAGEALAGASVIVKGTTNGVNTDVNGNYSINVAGKDDVLTVSFMSYLTKEVVVEGKTEINIVLKEDLTELDEVVFVGYTTVKKVNLTGAVGQASGEVLSSRPISNIGQGLQGVIPNLQITPGGNAPGQGASFNIRGYTSLNGGGPLILVDGVVQDPNLVNPNDIESVSVLMDASSAAIYGARAAYGVILFTTKSGKKNQKPTINITTSWANSTPIYQPKYMDSWNYIQYMDLASRNNGGGDYFDERMKKYAKLYYEDPANNLPVYYDPAIDLDGRYQYCGNTDWTDELYKNGALQQHNLSLSGGSERSRYYFSYGFMKEDGVLASYDDNYQRHTVNLDLSSDVFDWMTFGANVKYAYGQGDHPSGGLTNSGLSWSSGLLKSDLRPIMPVRHPDGNFAGQGNFTNPFAVGALAGQDLRKTNDFWVTGKLKITPVKNLNLNTDFTFNPYSYNRSYSVKTFKEYRADGSSADYPWARPNRVIEYNNNDYYTALNIYADYSVSVSKHNFKLLVGYNQEVKTVKNFSAERQELIDNDLPVLDRATGVQYTGGGATSWAVQGAFGRLNYDYDEKYLVEINSRYDGASKFASGKRFSFFPSFSLAWRVTNEEFMESFKDVLNEFKIRGSYGSLGNQNLNTNFPYVPGYSINTSQSYLIGGVRGVTVTAPGLVSANFTWETVTQWNIGFDYGFLNNRLNGYFNIFRRDTKGMLTAGQPLPAVLGTGVPQENAADLKTAGWDLTVNWRDRIGEDLFYNVGFVISDAQAEITKFHNPTGSLGAYYVGREIGEIWGYKASGLFQTADEIASAPKQNRLHGGTWNPGDVRYVDTNGDGEISNGKNTLEDHGDLSIIGNTTPRYQYGITLGASWKGFDIDIFLQGVGKRSWNPDGRFWGIGSEWDVPLKDASDFWTIDNTGAYLPRPYIDGGHGNRQTSDRYLQNAAYLRFKQMSIGYTLPGKWTEKLAISKARIYLTGQNIFTWTKLAKMYDPEIIGTAGRDTGVVGTMTYPIAKAYSIGLNLTF